MDKVGFLGAGAMGAGMVRNLLKAGFTVSVYNRTAERAAPLADAGSRVVRTPRAAAVGAEAVISMVADDDASRHVWLGDEGALSGVSVGTVLVECSTLSPRWVRELSSEAAARGCSLIDAPVTGSKPEAEAGQLLLLVGGEAAELERVRLILKSMSRGMVHLGPTGSGATMKLINNFLCGVQAASLAEAMAMIEQSELNRATAVALLVDGAPGSRLVKLLAPRMETFNYATNFALRWMRKDLDYAVDEADRQGLPLRTGAAARALFDEAVEHGFGEADFSAVVEALRGRRTVIP